MVLVPATMSLLGRWNWWMPASLDRVLPGVRAEITDADLALLAAASAAPTTDSTDTAGEREPVGTH
jgi:RND superfamily putative drug exporter